MDPLLRATLDDPSDRDAHAVYADWLSQAGSPLGHAIQADLAGVRGLALARLYAPCIEAILGPLIPYVSPLEIRWGRVIRGTLRQRVDDRSHPFWSGLELQPPHLPHRHLSTVPSRFVTVFPLSNGLDRRLWLAWDTAKREVVTLAMLDEQFSPVRLVPTERFAEGELYPAALEPLPVEPWPRALHDAVQTLRDYVEADLDHPLHPQFHQQCLLSEGKPVLLGTPRRPASFGEAAAVQPSPGWAAAQTRGSVRVRDEDAWAAAEGRFVVLDGMGGHTPADAASVLAARAFVDSGPSSLQESLLAAHRALLNLGDNACCTGVAARVLQNAVELAWIGDGRVYRLGANGLEQLTHDQTLVQRRVDAGLLTAAEARTHPERGIVLASLGFEPCSIETLIVPVQAGDRLLLCTDGLYEHLEPAVIASALGAPDVHSAARRILDALHQRVLDDNAAFIVLDPALVEVPKRPQPIVAPGK